MYRLQPSNAVERAQQVVALVDALRGADGCGHDRGVAPHRHGLVRESVLLGAHAHDQIRKRWQVVAT